MSSSSQKDKWIEQIYNDYPDLKNDALKRHYVEQMVESYLADEKKFKSIAYEMRKKGDIDQKPIPDEIVAISKVETKEPVQVHEVHEVQS
jgi:hypothetical protein